GRNLIQGQIFDLPRLSHLTTKAGQDKSGPLGAGLAGRPDPYNGAVWATLKSPAIAQTSPTPAPHRTRPPSTSFESGWGSSLKRVHREDVCGARNLRAVVVNKQLGGCGKPRGQTPFG